MLLYIIERKMNVSIYFLFLVDNTLFPEIDFLLEWNMANKPIGANKKY